MSVGESLSLSLVLFELLGLSLESLVYFLLSQAVKREHSLVSFERRCLSSVYKENKLSNESNSLDNNYGHTSDRLELPRDQRFSNTLDSSHP